MASPLKFVLDFDAKITKLLQVDKVLTGIAKGLALVDPQLRHTMRAFNLLMAAPGRSLSGLKAGVTGLRSGLNAAGSHMGGFTRDALAQFTALASFSGMTALARGVVGVGRSLIETVASGERADKVLTSLVGPEKFKTLDALASQISAGTEFDDDNLKKFSAGLLRVGFAFDKLPTALALGADIAALTDADPAQTLAEVGSALERLQQKGGLDFKILGGMGIAKKDFFGGLGKRLGISMEDAEARASAGKVKIETVMAQLVASVRGKTGKALGAAGAEMGGTLFAALERLKRVPEDWFKTQKNTAASAMLAESFNSLAAELAPEGKIGAKITAALGQLFKGGAEWLKNLNFSELAESVTDLVEALKLFGQVAGGIAKALGWVGKGLGEAAAALVTQAEPTRGFDFAEKVARAKQEQARTARIQKERAETQGRMTALGLASGAKEGLPMVWRSAADMADAATEGTGERLKIQSPSKVFEDMGRLTTEGFARGMEGGRPATLPAPSADIGIGMSLGRAAGGTRPVTISAPITVNYTGPGGADAAGAIASAIADILPGQLQHAFERMSAELGTG